MRDPRGGGRSSARLTAPTVAAGAIAKKWLASQFGVRVRGYMSQLGPIAIPFSSWDDVPGNAFYAPNAAVVPELEAYMDQLRRDGDSVGARIEVVAEGLPAGWGEPIYDRLDADIAHAMMGLNAVKGVSLGAGFESIAQRGSEHGDEITRKASPAITRAACWAAFRPASRLPCRWRSSPLPASGSNGARSTAPASR